MKDTKILKHDNVLALTRIFDTMDEIRFFNSCLVLTNQKKTFADFLHYPLDIAGYADKGGISLGQAYDELVKLVEIYKNKNIEIPLGNGQIWVVSLIHSYIKDDDTRSLQVLFDERLIPYISGRMSFGEFVYIDDRMGATSSKKRYLLYELLHKRLYNVEINQSFTILTKEIREYLKIPPEEYKEYKFLNVRVIKPTIEDIWETLGIKLSYKGNKVSITFTREEGHWHESRRKKGKLNGN